MTAASNRSPADTPRVEVAPANDAPNRSPTDSVESAAPRRDPARRVRVAKPARPKPVAEVPKPLANAAPEAPVKAAPLSSPEANTGKSSKDVIRELRRQRGQRLALRLFLFVILPTLLAGVYYGLIASPQYESTALIRIHSAEHRKSSASEGSVLGSLSSGAYDALGTRDYAVSRDMLRRLDAEYHLIAHYHDRSHDWLSRLSAHAGFEDAYEYYKGKVSADYDNTTGTLTLRVRAFSPNEARTLAQAILDLGEKQVNELNKRERNDQIRLADRDLATTEKRLVKARKALAALQLKYGDFSPQRVVALAQRVRVLEARAAQGNAGQVNPKSDDDVIEVIGDFEAATIEKEFAQKAYESARAASELAHAEALHKHRYIQKISEPSMPDKPAYPRRALGVLTVFLVSFMVWGIGLLLIAAVREHAQV